MTTDHQDARGSKSRRMWSRSARVAAVGTVAAVALAGCSASDGYVDVWFDNGDPVYSPTKDTLFDEAGVALCETPTVYGTLETRSRSFAVNGGVVMAFLFEITNDEPDPETAEDEKQRAQFERQQNSLEAMYQLTDPAFDAEYSISGADDLASKKEEWREHLSTLGEDAPIDQYVRLGSSWLDTPDGRYQVRRVTDVEGFIEDNDIPTTFRGQVYNYSGATSEDGTEYLLITSKETGDTRLLNAEEDIPVDESSELFVQYEVDLDVGLNNLPEAELTLAYDQCPSLDGEPVARYWVYDFEMLDGTEPEAVESLL